MIHEVYLDADSCEKRLVTALERQGFDVALGTLEVEDGASDEAQLARAVSMRRVIVTGNARDFARIHAEWAARNEEHFGIVTIRRERPRSPELVATLLAELLVGTPEGSLRNSIHRV